VLLRNTFAADNCPRVIAKFLMPAQIRKATAADAAAWKELLIASLGVDYPNAEVYDEAWIALQLEDECQTWVADQKGRLLSSISFLPPRNSVASNIVNLGRHLFRPEALDDGSATALLAAVHELCAHKRAIITRVFASDNAAQILVENAGYACVGFQPYKHLRRTRDGVLFYARLMRVDREPKALISESLPQIIELASAVFLNLQMPPLESVRDGVTGYPVQSEASLTEATIEDYERALAAAQSSNPPTEVSGRFNLNCGFLRVDAGIRSALLARADQTIVGGLAYCVDGTDRSVRVTSTFSTDNLSVGCLFQKLLKMAQELLNAVYVEVDVLKTAPRLLKTTEQLGFVPIAYLPGFYEQGEASNDSVKLVKLNLIYTEDSSPLTSQARSIAEVIDHHFQDQKMGVAIINLLRGLPFFNGLGDGELRKVARLFTQKLYRPGEKVFNKGDSGSEAYVVMRGQVNILLEEDAQPIAVMGNGQIFGELAFLDGAARGGLALAVQPSILLVIQRSAFNLLVQHEPHLGMVVMRNIAIELSNRLRKMNTALLSSGKGI
ncbi:MAG: hypothetical protein JWM99_2472, partial [Verrucomicrobiales bacterium]|nr:hypothetical protein [Verrucomicrobiales bacterium]